MGSRVADEDTPLDRSKDRSNGWEAVAAQALEALLFSTVGVDEIRQWTGGLKPGGAVLDVGAGPGGPRSRVLHEQGFRVFAIDAAPSLSLSYAQQFPSATVACEAIEDSSLFDRGFDGIVAWGLVFLLPVPKQRRLIEKLGRTLLPGGRLLFTAPRQKCSWKDLTTGRPSSSLGEGEYLAELERAGLKLVNTFQDAGENHYFEALRGEDPPQR